jgi:hypothetical protein
VFALNTHSGSPDLDDCSGTLGVFGINWFSELAGCTCLKLTPSAAYFPLSSVSEIGPLRFNGGSTRTHAIAAGSQIIDSSIASEGLGDPPVDQRGGARGIGFGDDAGAVEYDALPAGLIFADGFELGNLWAWG